MAWYDYDNSGGLNLGDIGAGLSNVSSYLLGTDAVGDIKGTTGLLGGQGATNAFAGLGAYLSYDAANKNRKSQEAIANRNFGLMNSQYERGIAKEDKAQAGLETGYANSTISMTEEERRKRALAQQQAQSARQAPGLAAYGAGK